MDSDRPVRRRLGGGSALRLSVWTGGCQKQEKRKGLVKDKHKTRAAVNARQTGFRHRLWQKRSVQ